MELVAKHMAILLCTNPSRDLNVISYDSDPILTFGAGLLWHYKYIKYDPLSKYMLPKFRDLVRSGDVSLSNDTLDLFVVRVLLLLAMDYVEKVAMTDETDINLSIPRYGFDLFKVPELITHLMGVPTQEVPGLAGNLDAWTDWQVAFSRFIPLVREPTGELLRWMHERRAAGIVPPQYRSQGDLVIPIAKGDTTSMIRVYLTDQVNAEFGKYSTEEGISVFISDLSGRFTSEASSSAQILQQIHSSSRQAARQLKLKSCILVLAIDEASVLYELQQDGTRRIDTIRNALSRANQQIAFSYCRWPNEIRDEAGVIGLLVDSDPTVWDGAASLVGVEKEKRFPPFVLTQPLDVLYNTARRIGALPADAFQRLELMGRPLWWSLRMSSDSLIKLAALKLLGGCGYLCDGALEKAMGGVAAILCRVGVSARMSSPLAVTLVDEHMAVLSYASPQRDLHVVSYVSDPVLTLGAAYLWYNVTTDPLAKRMLPVFFDLVLRDAVDVTAETMELFVARMIMLLAIGACSLLPDNLYEPYQYEGELLPLPTFLQHLYGPHIRGIQCSNGAFSPCDGDATAFLATWCDWFISFSNFLPLQLDPSASVLTWLLERRAGGISRAARRVHGANLVLPIVKGDEVSMICVHVNKAPCTHRLNPYPSFATNALHVFMGDVRGQYMNDDTSIPSRVWLRVDDRSVLHLRGSSWWETHQSDDESPATFVTPSVAKQLYRLLCVGGDVREPADSDFKRFTGTERSVFQHFELCRMLVGAYPIGYFHGD
ncbi:hypothetical protein Poli38472_007966 [Pythium oligandrum]|uniref:Uncharacterized protein n=1 Tax=Pythium oligandrum TaxID=41045 RepID=A0A8K1FLJ5_PYTOL|nr:hypothetical protein Poli38472_007966 [Pythium oligandrum]|eukprot:TMW65324.1 hypothetical protein Poli38472_007966 [Pythium oligandrum]